jgi:hypothetical protein
VQRALATLWLGDAQTLLARRPKLSASLRAKLTQAALTQVTEAAVAFEGVPNARRLVARSVLTGVRRQVDVLRAAWYACLGDAAYDDERYAEAVAWLRASVAIVDGLDNKTVRTSDAWLLIRRRADRYPSENLNIYGQPTVTRPPEPPSTDAKVLATPTPFELPPRQI